MRAIFLSYRRDDSEGEAGRLFDDLVGEFGADKVFMDVAGIEPGRDFRKVIDQNVASCGVLLAMIGKNWIDAKDESGRRRLDDPVDFVRLETASALTRDIPVVPVLVHGGRMPRSEQLPEDLKDLAYRNAVELTHARWASDVQVLIKALRSHVSGGEGMVLDPPPIKSSVRASNEMGVGPTISPSPTQQTKKSWRAVVVAAVAAIVIAAGVVGLNEYKKAEEARISRAAAEAAAKQAAEDQRGAVDKEAADRAAKQQAADQAAARKVAVEQAAARKAAAEKAVADQEAARKAAVQQAEKAAAEKAAADQEAARKKRQSAPSEVDGELFLAENRTKAGVIELPSGLQYKIVKAGYGPKPTATDSVTCNYRGRFIDGTEFDSSYKRGQPATFPLAAVIKGWTEALQLMPVGSKWVVYVPPRLAYGNRGVGNVIGPGATLIFEIELVSIKGRDTK